MSIPIKHHFLPEFYMRSWADLAGQVVAYGRPYKDVEVKRRYPSEVGFKKELYAIKSRTDPGLRQEIESKFMALVDQRASDALDCLLTSGSKPEDPKLRDGWSRFMMSLLHRHPRRIEHIAKAAREKWDEDAEEIDRDYRSRRSEGDPDTLEEWAKMRGMSPVDELRGHLLKDIMDSEMIGGALNNMHWAVDTIPSPKYGLVTSDFPLLIGNGVGQPDTFVILPLSETKYFIAARDMKIIETFRIQIGPALERGFNDAVVSNASELVVAADDTHKKFVENRLGKGLTLGHELMPGVPIWRLG